MQKDFHHDLTGLAAIYAGFTPEKAAEFAWANQFTDECTKGNKYGRIRTQCDIFDQWNMEEVQQFVIIPFHFLPGDDPNNKWLVTPGCSLAERLLQDAFDRSDSIAFGIALHAMQDTFSHQSFTGWQDEINKNPSLSLLSIMIPRIGHAEFLRFPDDIGAVWDRNGVQVNNKQRALNAAIVTYAWLFYYLGRDCQSVDDFTDKLEPFWKIKNYDDRKKWAQKKSGLGSYSDYKPTQEQLIAFARAARRQVSQVMEFVA